MSQPTAQHTEMEVTQPSQEATAPTRRAASQPAKTRRSLEEGERPIVQADRVSPKGPTLLSQARSCLLKAKLGLKNSKNIKTEIKLEVTAAVERMYSIVQESESERTQMRKEMDELRTGLNIRIEPSGEKGENNPSGDSEIRQIDTLSQKIDEHCLLMAENTKKMESLQAILASHHHSYAEVTAGKATKGAVESAAVHSVIVASDDDTEKGEVVLERIRKAIDAREGGIRIESVRKTRDRRIVVGCKTEDERKTLKNKIKHGDARLKVEDIANKDPLIILKGVMKYNSDEETIKALRNQNPKLFQGLTGEDDRAAIKFKKPARNQLTQHVVLRVSPPLWRRLVEAAVVHIDLQRVRVEDHSPLTQCSLCLGYGHTRRQCQRTEEKCSRCVEPHTRENCPKLKSGGDPKCCNCAAAKRQNIDHGAFSTDCPIRQRYERMSREMTNYQC